MKTLASNVNQRGAVTIFVSMIMLLLITVLVFTAYSMSTMNLQAVGNAQVRQEAVAAANQVIEQVIDSTFYNDPVGAADTPYGVDMNGDFLDDYIVNILPPVCIRATEITLPLSFSVTLPTLTVGVAWQTVWEIDATATEVTTGASARVLHGVRILLTDSVKTAKCA